MSQNRNKDIEAVKKSLTYTKELKKIYIEMIALQKKITKLSSDLRNETCYEIEEIFSNRELELNAASNSSLNEVLAGSLKKEQELYATLSATSKSEATFEQVLKNITIQESTFDFLDSMNFDSLVRKPNGPDGNSSN